MGSRTTKQIANMLRIHPGRIEQWISRGQFLPKIFAEKGLGREWSFDEALRLFIFVQLVDVVGMDPRTAGLMTETTPTIVGDEYFVGYCGRPEFLLGWHAEVVKKARVGEFLRDCCLSPTVMAAGNDATTRARNSEPPLRGPAIATVLLDLDEITRGLTKAWEG